MKKFKVLGIILAAVLVMFPVGNTYASEIAVAGKYEGSKLEPTLAIGQTTVEEVENNNRLSLCSDISDYDGRIKMATYNIDGVEWTVVEKIGVSFADEKLPEGMSEWENVYRETFVHEVQTEDSYTPITLTNTRQYYKNDNLVASICEEYEVWYFSSGLVHLLSYSLSKSTASGYGSSDFVIGNIVNTDGSVSYISGFKFVVRGLLYSATYDINFVVTPSYYQFY